MCTKIFAGPEDPSTELTSYLLNVGQGASPNELVLEKNFFLDSECKKPNGQQSATIVIDECFAGSPNSMQYNNATQSSSLPASTAAGTQVLGFQEYQTCSNNKAVTQRIVYPNDACYPNSGKTSKGVAYLSYSLYCSGNVLTQSFFSDSACVQAVADESHKLGTSDSTCYVNQSPDYDYNLFQTVTCVGDAAARPLATGFTHSEEPIHKMCSHHQVATKLQGTMTFSAQGAK